MLMQINGCLYKINFNNTKMMDANSDDSEDEGFVSNRIRIDQQSVKSVEKEQTLFKEFQPHYIVAEGLIRKEIPQSISSFANIPSRQRVFANKDIVSNNSEHPPTAKELYMNTKYYSLIYKRYKQPFGSETKATFQHPINLLCCQNYKQDNFKVLKDWDQLSMSEQPYSENCLIFDSRFEGGNLLCAFRAKKETNTYILFMQNDTNTYGYNQWFYFSIRNMKNNTKYTFRVANFKKRYSFFENGMQPLIFSLKTAQSSGNGWYRDGFNISYYPSQFKEHECTPYYTAEFSLQFEHENDYLTISPNAPYSYSKLISRLRQFQTIAIDSNLNWKLKPIAKTISFNQVPYLILSKKKVKKTTKKKVIIIARQHPGETWSSYLVQSIIQRLVEQKSIESKWLLQQYDFHIMPMINVDGVIYGNFRCDLAGSDLNRTWKNPIEKIQPQIYHIKKQISKLSEKYEIQLCLDLHTHSRQYGAFAYCCVDTEECRELPKIISACSPLFRYKACTFGISGDKKYTARAAVFGLTNSMHTITVEISSYGFKLNSRKYPVPFAPGHMLNISKGILQGFYAYKKRIEPLMEEEELLLVDDWEADSVNLSELKSEIEQEQKPVSESDSEPQIDQIQLQIKINTIFPASFIEDIAQTAKNSKIPNFNQIKSKLHKVKKFNQSIHRNKVSNKFSIRKHESEHRPEEAVPQKTLDLVQTKTIELQRVTPAVIRTKRQSNIPSHHSYKKQSTFISEKSHKISADRPTKPVNLVQFSLKKLPLSVPEKIVQNHHILLDEGIPSIAAYSYGKRQDNRFDKTFSTYEAMCRPRVRLQSKKIGIVREDSRLEQELPFLCIMSETKKQVQMEKLKEKQEGRQAERRNQSQKHHYSGLNPPSRLFETPVAKNNWPKNIQMIEKVGMDHFTRYAESTFFRKN